MLMPLVGLRHVSFTGSLLRGNKLTEFASLIRALIASVRGLTASRMVCFEKNLDYLLPDIFGKLQLESRLRYVNDCIRFCLFF